MASRRGNAKLPKTARAKVAAWIDDLKARAEIGRRRAAQTMIGQGLDIPITPAMARVMNTIARHGCATLENHALVPTAECDAEITVLYADSRFVRLVRRFLDGHAVYDAFEAVIPAAKLAAVVKDPIGGPLFHTIS